MNAYTVENSIAEGRREFEALFDFVRKNYDQYKAHEMEKIIFQMIMPIGLAAMKAYFEQHGTGDLGKQIRREDGMVLRRDWEERKKNYISLFGTLPVLRTYYHAPGEPGIFPLDQQVNLPQRCYSYFVQELMNILSLDHSFQEGAKRLKDFFGLELVESVMVNVSREGSQDYDEFYEQKAPPAPEEEKEYDVASFDGKGVPVIKEEAIQLQAKLGKGEKRQKKKEALVGVSYSVDRKERTPEDVAENLVYPERARTRQSQDKKKPEEPKGQNIRRLASLKRSKASVIKEIKKDVERRDPSQSKPLVVLLDGDLGLWSLVLSFFAQWKGGVTYILDIIHVRDYLWEVANALYGEKSVEGRKWVHEKLIQILKGNVGYTVGGLRQIITKRNLKGSKRKALKKAITYFEHHKKWMKYDEYLAAGMPVATGVVESACGSVVKKRMEGEGKRWSVDGAESILLLRSLEKSNDYKTYWKFHINQERKRLYENQPKYIPYRYLDKAA